MTLTLIGLGMIALLCAVVIVCVLWYAIARLIERYVWWQVMRGNRSSRFACTCGRVIRVADVLDTKRGVHTCTCGMRYVYIFGKLVMHDPVPRRDAGPEYDDDD